MTMKTGTVAGSKNDNDDDEDRGRELTVMTMKTVADSGSSFDPGSQPLSRAQCLGLIKTADRSCLKESMTAATSRSFPTLFHPVYVSVSGSSFPLYFSVAFSISQSLSDIQFSTLVMDRIGARLFFLLLQFVCLLLPRE